MPSSGDENNKVIFINKLHFNLLMMALKIPKARNEI